MIVGRADGTVSFERVERAKIMKGVLLLLCVFAGLVCASTCSAAEVTFAPAPEAAEVPGVIAVDCVAVAEAPACVAGVCAVPVRSAALVRGQPVRNVGRVMAAPVRAAAAIVRAKPLRRAAAAIVRAKPLRRVVGVLFCPRCRR